MLPLDKLLHFSRKSGIQVITMNTENKPPSQALDDFCTTWTNMIFNPLPT